MRIFNIDIMISVTLSFVFCVAISSFSFGHEVETLFVDPMFNISYQPKIVKFQLVNRKSLPKSCALIASRLDWQSSATVLYAKYTVRGITDLVIGNRNGGTLLQSKGSQCSSADVLVALLRRHHEPRMPNDGPALSESEIEGIFNDTLIRHTQAFGSKKLFISYLDRFTESLRGGCKGIELVCPPSFHTLPKILQDRLVAFRNES